MKDLEQIAQQINGLTSDEDFRQELWVYYLEGNQPESFIKHLIQLQHTFLEGNSINRAANDLVSRTISEELLEAINRMNQFNKSVALLMLLGYAATDISVIKQLSLVRTKQVMKTIMNNKTIKRLRG